MSVQETYAIAIDGPDEGLAIAMRLAERVGSTLRWVALWTVRSGVAGCDRQLEDGRFLGVVTRPSLDQVRSMLAQADGEPVCAHWSAPLYVGDEGPPAPWIAFVDPFGGTRDDAVVYSIELAGGAQPRSTLGDRPSAPGIEGDFELGPAEAKGWALHTVVVRDHMPRAELVAWIAAACGVDASRIRPAD